MSDLNSLVLLNREVDFFNNLMLTAVFGFVIFVCIIFYLALRISILEQEKSPKLKSDSFKKHKNRTIILAAVVGVSSLSLFVYSSYNFTEYDNQKEELSEDIYGGLNKVKEVEIKEVFLSKKITSHFCVEEDKENKTSCFYLYVATDDNISQLFVRLGEDDLLNIENNLTVTVLDLTKEESAFVLEDKEYENYVEYHSFENFSKNNWALAVDIK